MSNALWAPVLAEATTSALAEATSITSFELSMLAVGVCVLVAWALLRGVRPAKLTLRGMPGRPNDLNPLVVMPLYLLVMVIGNLAAVLIAWLGDIESKGQHFPPTVNIPAMIVAQVVLIVLSVALAARAFRSGLRRGLGLSGRRWFLDSLRAVIALLAVWPVCIALVYVTTRLMPDSWQQTHSVLTFVRSASGAWLAVTVAATVVLAPIAEELFWRGLLQSMLRRRFGPWASVLIASGAFACIHVVSGPQAIPALFALAVVLGYSYERTGRLLAPMLIHALFNAANLYVEWSGARV